MRRSGTDLLLLLALIWGASFLFIRIGVETIPPAAFVGLRLVLAVPIVYILLRVKHIAIPRERQVWLDMALLGLLNAALPYTLFAWGEKYISSGLAAIYNASTPLWAVIFAQLWVREERLTPLRTVGVALGFFGVVWLVSDDLHNLLSTSFLSQLAVIIAGASYAVAALFARRRLSHLPGLTQTFGQLFSALIWLSPLILLSPETYRMQPSLHSLLAAAALSVLGTAVGTILYFKLLSQVGATRTALVTYLLPGFGLFWGWLILNERIEPRMIGALLVILLGMLAVNGRLPARRRKQLSTTYTQRVDEQTFDSQ